VEFAGIWTPLPGGFPCPLLWLMPPLRIASPGSGGGGQHGGSLGTAEEDRSQGRAVLERFHAVLTAGVDLGCGTGDAGWGAGDGA